MKVERNAWFDSTYCPNFHIESKQAKQTSAAMARGTAIENLKGAGPVIQIIISITITTESTIHSTRLQGHAISGFAVGRNIVRLSAEMQRRS